ncbi:(-)-germacrene D synthase-like isoform X2 [Syzygium oleosum]|uniref:(-)-germacrene D synthase-like isoform X2 n=1 Tax=Syzygium oleosum TaxID=219896 RepID=UPI0024B9C209|nr:(-)-germacrene D synthase-like isoform X2 [Syzygium oleosum]
MSLPILAIPPSSPAQETSRVAERRSANFHPGIWGDYFLKYASDSNSMSFPAKAKGRIERLKGEVRKMLTDATDKPSQKLNLIDQIQRLGIAYHFEIEINQQLEQIHKSYFELHDNDNNDDLHTVALLFRLLRQQSYTISCEIFNKFRDREGNFSESLIADVQGLLSLFEACHLRFHGDDILNDALAFTITHLETIDKGKASPKLKKQVSHALNQPIYNGIPRLEARRYIPLYQDEPLHNEVLLSLAKLDFNLLQEQHQKELGNLTRWDVDAKDGLPEYMQACYKTVFDLYDEIGYEMTRKGRPYRLFFAKEAMKNLVRAYFTEAKWFHQNHVPTMEEYMPIALQSAAVELLLVTLLLGMGDFVTKDAFDWVLYVDPKMVKAVKLVVRLLDDIAGHKFEQERGHVASSVECFMKQYGVTEEEAKEELRKQVADAWKDINEELHCPTIIPRPLLVRIHNFARTMHVVYKDEIDLYTHGVTEFKKHVTSLYVNPLPM